MRHIRTAIVAVAITALAATGLSTTPTAGAAPVPEPSCTPDAVTGLLNGLFGGPAPVGTPYTCAVPVHPGAVLDVDGSEGGAGGGCTANFVFAGADGRHYLGTAGHCTLAESNVSGDVGEFAYPPNTGALVRDGSGREIGRIAYAIQQDPYDFALIRLRPDIDFGTALPHWGPTNGRINTVTAPGVTVLRWVGHGLVIGDLLYARTGLALGTSDPDLIFGLGLIAPRDSGSPVVDDQGRAVGVNVAIGAAVGTEGGVQIITRLAPQLARAELHLGDLTLL